MRIKYLQYLLYIISPILLGFVFSVSSYISILGTIFSYILPIAFIFYWFFVGTKFANLTDNPIIAILSSHIMFILSGLFVHFNVKDMSGKILNILNFFISKTTLSISPIIDNIFKIFKKPLAVNTLVYVSVVLAIIIFIVGYVYNYQRFVRNRYGFDKKLFKD